MEKLSQLELMNETFSDIMRGLGSAIKVGAEAIAPEIIDPAKKLAAPAINATKAFRSHQPKIFAMKELKDNYFQKFNPKTIKLGKPSTGGLVNSNETVIPFEAEPYDKSGVLMPRSRYVAHVLRGPKGLQMFVKDAGGKSITAPKLTPTTTPTMPKSTLKIKSAP